MRANLPDKSFFLGKDVPEKPGYVIVESLGSGGNAHVFRAHSEEFRHDLACKVIPRANLVDAESDKPKWLEEVTKATTLSTRIVVSFSGKSEWRVPESAIDCVVLLFEYVKGKDLSTYIKEHKNDIRVDFVEGCLKTLLQLLDDMAQHNVRHGDIHEGNILVEDRTGQLGVPPYAFRVTDFGVISASSESSLRDDYDQVAVVLRSLLDNVNYQIANARDRFCFNVLNTQFLARHLTERDVTRDPLARQPAKLFERLEDISRNFHEVESAAERVTLSTPFDYLSCELLGDSHGLLRALYSNKFLGIADIEARNNLVLTGPRGCGKSTVFKSLSLRHRVMSDDDAPEQIGYIGVYYRCDDLYWVFPRYSLPEREGALDLPLHYVTSTLASEALSSVKQWAIRHFPAEFERLEKQLCVGIWETLGFRAPEDPGAQTFDAVVSRLGKERGRAARKQRFVKDQQHPMRDLLGPDVLPKLCTLLVKGLPVLSNRPFYFFVDDYSSPKISPELQRNLNRLLMQRTANCFFKVSTESPISYERADVDGKAYVEGREFCLLNLGLVFLQSDTREKLHFIEDVFERRFKAIDRYPVSTLVELVGEFDGPGHNQTALALRNGEKLEVWGTQSLCDLCSGDIFYIIGLVGRMVRDSGGRDGLANLSSTPKIDKRTQSNAIREEAGSFLQSLRGIRDGDHLVQIVTAFGAVAFSYLKYRESKNESGNPPHLASRIEPLEALSLSEQAESMYRELLRYSLFIEDPRGKSRRGKVVSRLYLRRSLLPHFKLTFSRRDSVQLEREEIEQLLLNPEEFERTHRLKSSLEGDVSGAADSQMDISEIASEDR